ncbi:MAG: type III pantothenate kinase [Saprospiraceae bacterium]
MILCIDIGNTNIVIALNKDNSWTNAFRYETKNNQPIFFYEQALRSIFLEWEIPLSACKHICISCVVPELKRIIEDAVINVTGNDPLVIDSSTYPLIDMHIPLHQEIGSDLVCNAYATLQRCTSPCMVIDFGTALTFTLISREKGIFGVTIAPGIKSAIHALDQETALLPAVPLELPPSAIGHNTVTAIQSGILWGYVGLVNGLIDKIESELGEKVDITVTGGLSAILSPVMPRLQNLDKMLTLDGMRLIYHHLQTKNAIG